MLKGHATIELTDVNTGKVEVHEEDNLVTNAISDILNKLAPFANLTNYSYTLLPIYTKLTNGLLLFQNPLEEDVNNMAMPSPLDNPLVGYASNTAYSGTDTKRGSVNANETQALVNGYKYVWDFATSQANGEISALALTSYRNGASPYSIPTTTNNMVDIKNVNLVISSSYIYHFRNIIDYDNDNKTWTNLYMSDITTLHIEKVQMSYKSIWPDKDLGAIRVLEDTIIDLADCGVTLSASNIWLDGDDGYYYTMFARGAKTMNVVRFDKNNFKFDTDYGTKTFTHPYGNYFYCTADDGDIRHSVTILNGYLYAISSGTLCKFNLNNPDDMSYRTTPNNLSSTYFLAKCNNTLYSGKLVIFEDLSYYIKNNNGSAGFYYTEDGSNAFIYVDECGAYDNFIFNSSGKSVYLHTNTTHAHLATINNLSTPVTKTASQTMKITYTLMEVNE